MNDRKQLDDTVIKTSSTMLWIGMQASMPMFVVAIFYMGKILLEPVLPELKNVIIGICILSIPVPFILLNRFKRSQRKIRDNLRLGIDNLPADLQRYITYLITGMSLCGLPGILGLIYYIFVNDVTLSLVFIGIAFSLGFLFKPDLK